MTLRICAWTTPSCLSLAGEFWLAPVPGSAAQRRTNRAREIKCGKDMWSGNTNFLANCIVAPLADWLDFWHIASPALDTTNLPAPYSYPVPRPRSNRIHYDCNSEDGKPITTSAVRVDYPYD